jgi:hypothetical protein
MHQSVEEQEESLCLDDIIIIESPSLVEKSIIFSLIEQNLTEQKVETLWEQLKFNSVLHELKMNSLHTEYNKKMYNMILRQLLKDYPERLAAKMWKRFVNSF